MMNERKLRIIQCYTGDIAKEQIRMIANHPDLELVGALVYHSEKVGMDAGTIAGIRELSVPATDRLDEIIALDADVVLHNAPREGYEEILPLLESGKNVITVVGGNNTVDTPFHASIVAACEKGGVSFMGSGINPGLAPDVLPMVASSLCERVDHVHVYAGGNLTGVAPIQLEMMGFGKLPAEASANSVFVDYVAEAYIVTTRLLARALSFEIDDVRTEVDVQTPIRNISGPYPISMEHVAGVRLSTSGYIGEKCCVTVECTWFIGRQNMPDAWMGPARDSGWTIKVTGEPDVELNLDLGKMEKGRGFKITAARVINDIPMIYAAKPGPLTYLDSIIPRAWNRH